jgi:hypothetical protein
VNPVERRLTHPFNLHVARAEADRLVDEALVMGATRVRAVDVGTPVGIRHRRRPLSPVPALLLTLGLGVLLESALLAGMLAGIEAVAGAR